MFADDTNLVMSYNSPSKLVTKLNTDLKKVDKWFIANKLYLREVCSARRNFFLNQYYQITGNVDEQSTTAVALAKVLGYLHVLMKCYLGESI